MNETNEKIEMRENENNVIAGSAFESASSSSERDNVEHLRTLLGRKAVLLPIPSRTKNPVCKGWQKTAAEKMDDATYLAELERGNIGVLLGEPSAGLCAIDIDSDNAVGPFLERNPKLKDTLRSKGARGQQIWVRISGEYPPLTKIHNEEGEDWGEWRATGGQSVIHGIHPNGNLYQLVNSVEPLEIRYEDIQWMPGHTHPRLKSVYETLVDAEGEPIIEGVRGGCDVNHSFFAAKYLLEHRLIYDSALDEMYEYNRGNGLWERTRDEAVKNALMLDVAHVANQLNNKRLVQKRTDKMASDLLKLIKSKAAKPNAFQHALRGIHVTNGMLTFSDIGVELKSFGPEFLARHSCGILYDPEAGCPRFETELLGGAMDDDDRLLFQKWFGMALLGGNPAHKILLLTGNAGGGKSTLMSVVESVVGKSNVGQLRDGQLGGRFETSSYEGKTLLIGKDVSTRILERKEAGLLKALSGGDGQLAEKKGVNERVVIHGSFNIAMISNGKLKVTDDEDLDAWLRRLLIIDYNRGAPETKITDFADVLMREEGPGILNFAIRGALIFLNEIKEKGVFVVTENQMARAEKMLGILDTVTPFVIERVEGNSNGDMTTAELLAAYGIYCRQKGFRPEAPYPFGSKVKRALRKLLGVEETTHIKRTDKEHRGYKNVGLREEDNRCPST